MDLAGVLEVGKWVLSATGIATLLVEWQRWRAARRVQRAQLYELLAEVRRNRVLVNGYLRNVRARFHYLTATARFQDPPHMLRDAIREVLPDARLPEIHAYLHSGVGKGAWFYRSGPPDWPPLHYGDRAVRREIALRFLPDPSLLDAWDLALEGLERNRDGLVDAWRQLEARPAPSYPDQAQTSPEQSDTANAAGDQYYENLVFDVIELASGLLAGADEAVRTGATLEGTLMWATSRTASRATRLRKWVGRRWRIWRDRRARVQAMGDNPLLSAGGTASDHNEEPPTAPAEESRPLNPRDLLLYPGMKLQIPSPPDDTPTDTSC